MKYTEFETQLVNTFNRLHCIESCDDPFCVEFADYDPQTILSMSFMQVFKITREYYDGYKISRAELIRMFEADEDELLIQALNSFNEVMDRYNVVPSTEYELLHII